MTINLDFTRQTKAKASPSDLNRLRARRQPTAAYIKARLGGQSPQQRGREKQQAALEWLILFHKTSPGIIRQVVGATASGYAAKLVRAGLAKYSTAPTLRSGKVIMLTADGIYLAEKLQPDHMGKYNLDASSISHATLKHDLAVQLGVLAIQHRLVVKSVIPERLIPSTVPGDKLLICTES